MKIPWRRRRPSPPEEGTALGADSAPSGRGRSDDDARILRGTRLRLMAVSGLVTLFILVVLGVAAYGVVARAIDDSERTVLQHYMDRHLPNPPTSGGPEAAELGGEGGNMFEIYVTPAGQVLAPRGQTLPAGLPDTAGLAAARGNSQGTDQRNITAPDGTQYTIVSAQAVGPGNSPGWLIQFVQNRTADARLLTTLLWVLLVGGGAALLASLLAGYLYAGRALVPIRQSIDRRQAALQRQREFAANASHELRTPLTVIGASVEDLQRNRRSRVEEVGDALTDIDAEVRHMTALVEDMLLLARTDSGVVEIERVPVDLGDIAAEATSMLTTLGQERNVKVVLDPLPAPLTGDPLRLRQLVTILVDNAIRHSPAGATVGVLVRAEAGAVVLQVDDHGPGIKPDDLPRLFERFWRADNAPAGGTGLGLAIARWIVEQHGGTIGAANRPEGGASFWARLPVVSLPAVEAEAGTAGPRLGAPASGAGPDAFAPAAEPPSWTPGEGGGPIS
ncbi:MAG: HAMP domain-containing sensor histidine kinase [Candidatus Limnocylindrales bacterium]